MLTSSKLFQCLFYLIRDPLASRFDTVVGKAARIALNDEDVELVFGVFLAEGGAEELEVFWVAPETAIAQLALKLPSRISGIALPGILIARRGWRECRVLVLPYPWTSTQR